MKKQKVNKNWRQQSLTSHLRNLLSIKPGWHPDWDRNLGFKIARVLFLAGVTKIEHSIWESRRYSLDIWNDAPLKKTNILNYPAIDSSCISDCNDKSRPLLWTILDKFNIGITGTSHDAFTQTSNVEHQNLLADIVLHFNYFNDNFKLDE